MKEEKTNETFENVSKEERKAIFDKMVSPLYFSCRRYVMVPELDNLERIIGMMHDYIKNENISDDEILDIYYNCLKLLNPEQYKFMSSILENINPARERLLHQFREIGFQITVVDTDSKKLFNVIEELYNLYPWIKDMERKLMRNILSFKYGANNDNVEDFDKSSMYDDCMISCDLSQSNIFKDKLKEGDKIVGKYGDKSIVIDKGLTFVSEDEELKENLKYLHSNQLYSNKISKMIFKKDTENQDFQIIKDSNTKFDNN